jgi:hypothetical protein
MATLNREQIVANALAGQGAGDDMTHTTLEVVKTATMSNGTLLKADGTEAVAGDLAAAIAFVIDDPKVQFIATGATDGVRVVRALDWVKFYGNNLKLGATALSAGELTTFAKLYA